MTASTTPCPCGGYPTGVSYADCCEPALTLREWPPTAQQLMRSRYTAHVRGDADHLFRTWHPSTRPADPDPEAGTRWTGLTIESVTAGSEQDDDGVVEYTAHWTGPDGQADELHEVARFVRRARRWMYLGPADVV